MARYVTRPKSNDDDWYYEAPLYTSIEAWESDPVNTGLLDSAGNAIWRVNDPVGFRF